MDADKTAAKFLKQARRGEAWWGVQRYVAMGLVTIFLAGSAYSLWTAWNLGMVEGEMPRTPVWLALAVASSMWAIHAEIMQGAAIHVARGEKRKADG